MITYSFGADFSSAFASLSGVQSDQTLLELLKLYLGIDPADTSDDEALTRALNIAGDSIETYLDRVVVLREVTEYFPHHFGTVILHEPQVNLTQNLTVYLNGVAQSGYSAWLDRGKFAHLSRSGIRQDTPMDWRVYDQVDVVYSAGYDPLPSDLAQAIVYTAADLFNSEGTGSLPGGGGGSGEIKSMTIHDVGSISYDVGGSSGSSGDGGFGSTGIVPDTAALMLTRYKRMSA